MPGATPQETIWQYRRGAGFVLGNGIYQSFFDLHGGYFDDPALMAEVQRLNRVLDDSKQYDCSSVAEILVGLEVGPTGSQFGSSRNDTLRVVMSKNFAGKGGLKIFCLCRSGNWRRWAARRVVFAECPNKGCAKQFQPPASSMGKVLLQFHGLCVRHEGI